MKPTTLKSGLPARALLATLLGTTIGCMAGSDEDRSIAGEHPSGKVPAELAAGALSESTRGLPADTKFFIPRPNPGASRQFFDLIRHRALTDALRIAVMATTPQAVWFTGGSPAEVRDAVRQTMQLAKAQRRVPVLVAYNVPFRDCAQYSAGGAIDTVAYQTWIDGLADGIGGDPAVVILEPDSLGIIPNNTTIYGAPDWCRPTISDSDGNPIAAPGANPEERYLQLSYAVDAIETKAALATVYLDGTHSAWLPVGEAAYRLVKAGVQRAQGFFLNVSNYQPTGELAQFGTWVSDCITAATSGAAWAAGRFDWCPGQYDPARGYAVNYTPEYAAGVTAVLLEMMAASPATTHFVIDTSRNGQGPWHSTVGYPDAQDWCNPQGRGVGLRPTATTGLPLADAHLWIKIPGESDGSCNRGVAGSTTDPEWGDIVDPPAGEWFPEQALQLATLANPALF